MRRLATFGLAAALALTGLSVATDADAGHRRWHDSGVSFGFSFGSPSYYDDYYYAPRYRPYYQPRRYAPRRQIRGNWRAHTEWCYARWRSYDAYNNSYQPYRGPRRECRSPYY